MNQNAVCAGGLCMRARLAQYVKKLAGIGHSSSNKLRIDSARTSPPATRVAVALRVEPSECICH